MVLHLVGKLNFFEFQEERIPINESNLDQVQAFKAILLGNKTSHDTLCNK